MSQLDEIYSREWFEQDFTGLQPEFNVVADAIVRQFRPANVVDVGCGPGMIVRRLRERGVAAMGLDGSRHAREMAHHAVQRFIVTSDLLGMNVIDSDRILDLVICTEVAEHLGEEHAPALVELLCSAGCPVVFTAAPPGQEGHHHVNCRPQGYWFELFSRCGAYYDADATDELAARWVSLKRLSHMRANVMVFT